MKNLAPGDASRNRALLFLSSLPLELAEDIARTCSRDGIAVLGQLDSSMPGGKPYVMLSSKVVDDEDFGYMLAGYNALLLSALARTQPDKKTYSLILQEAFGAPKGYCDALANNIETIDAITGKDSSWWQKIAANVYEFGRKAANAVGFDINQNQDLDIDLPTELIGLGKAVDQLNKRAKGISGLASIAGSLGIRLGGSSNLSKAAKAASESGEGKVSFNDDGTVPAGGDPVSASTARIGLQMYPYTVRRLPYRMYGDVAPAIRAMHQRMDHDLNTSLAFGGYKPGPHGIRQTGDAIDPVLATSLGSVLGDSVDEAGALFGDPRIAASPGLVNAILSLLHQATAGRNIAAAAKVAGEKYGDAVEDALLTGDVEALYGELVDLSTPLPSEMGDVEEDAIGDTLQEVGDEGGVINDPQCKTMGGLFTRWRINAKLKKGKRRRRRAATRRALESTKDYANVTDWDYNQGQGGGADEESGPGDDGSGGVNDEYALDV